MVQVAVQNPARTRREDEKTETAQHATAHPRATERAYELDNEEVLNVLRNHWIVHVPAMVFFFFFCGLSVLLILYHNQFMTMFNLSQNSWITMVLVFFALAFGMLARTFIMWFYNYFIITNCRILHFRIRNGFHYEAEEIMLDRVKYVDVHRPSLLALILNYGSLELGIDLNYQISTFNLRWIKAPHKVMYMLNDVI